MPNYIRPKANNWATFFFLCEDLILFFLLCDIFRRFLLRSSPPPPTKYFPSLNTFHLFHPCSSSPPETKYFSKYFFLFLLPCKPHIFVLQIFFFSKHFFSFSVVLLLHKDVPLLQILSPPFFFSVFLVLQISSISKYFLPFPSPPQTKYFPTFFLEVWADSAIFVCPVWRAVLVFLFFLRTKWRVSRAAKNQS